MNLSAFLRLRSNKKRGAQKRTSGALALRHVGTRRRAAINGAVVMPQMIADDARAQAAPRRLPTEQAKRMKVISFGSEGVGKSCLVKRFCEEKFVSKYISTIGIDFEIDERDEATVRRRLADGVVERPHDRARFDQLASEDLHHRLDVRHHQGRGISLS